MSSYFVLYCGLCVTVLKEVNRLVDEPYMDEPFHIPQAQAYCRGEFNYWDPKITTPPGLYIMSLILKKIFMFKCNLQMLRLTTMLSLLALPIALTRLISFHQRVRPPSSLLSPTPEAIILSFFPVGWFFGFLYYTEVPSLVLVVLTVVAASEDRHWLASLFGLMSCTFRQTNIIWVLYAFAASQLTYLRWRRAPSGSPAPSKLHDPPALSASPGDIFKAIRTSPSVIPDLLPSFVPYTLVMASFVAFVVWNGGIVLGDKSNHIPVLHVPQIYYFAAFSAAFGWPALISGSGSALGLAKEVFNRMFGSKTRTIITAAIMGGMTITVKLFTIHHPFLLSDNRHYTFYVWHRIYMFHWTAPYVLIPGYLACAWAWFLRVGTEQTILQALVLPVLASLTLLPTPLLEPRYFLIPYILLRSQITDVPGWALALEAAWYGFINLATLGKTTGATQRGLPLLKTPFTTVVTLGYDLFTIQTTVFSSPHPSVVMPPDSSSHAATVHQKPSTRSSIRQSLNFASVGKAFADVMNKESREKESKDSEKAGKKAMKESHRSSIGFRGLAPRPSLDTRPSPPPAKRPRTPDSKTITARRRSSMAHHQPAVENATKSPDSATPQDAAVQRSSSLRPRTGASSGLPKYRPKSIILDNNTNTTKKPESPSVPRKRPSISEDDKDDAKKEQMKPAGDRVSRPISPLPHRAALKAASTNINPSPSPSPKPHLKISTPSSSARSSPTRLVKHKKAPSTEPRPPSSASSSSNPHTPRASREKSGLRPASSSRKGSLVTESSDDSSYNSHPGLRDSPLVRHVRQRSRTETPAKEKEKNVANMSHISEGDSEDVEELDVEMMLAPVAAITAPTPAMPRIQASRTRQRLIPQTPSKPPIPQGREMLMPPDAESSPLRPRLLPASDRSAPRGSILSWEQFATEASRTLGEEEISTILNDISAPFQPGPLSPMPTGDLALPPESPCLSAMNSPSGYGSISHVLLPAVTPSPAIPRTRHKDSPANQTSGEAALVPLLRLQLNAAENTAKERLIQMQLLEEEVHNLKQARHHDAQELSRQFSALEEQMKGKLEAEGKNAEQTAAHVAFLEQQLRDAEQARQSAIEAATKHTQKQVKATLRFQQVRWDASYVAQSAKREWSYVREQCEDDLEALQRDKELITFLLGELDLAQQQLKV
ncbi:glucosyltransferase [Marasmius crinis-equi]|uniref:Dol-P-Glc:Glc(2)Man(9)GlcNAc(2)-PP-Dol alpha-1,2-glucosyltransferase n=1 Tax=Marasmius crinis-equi TaxID=585013 RepID=A0ABR3FTP0_9AGAR